MVQQSSPERRGSRVYSASRTIEVFDSSALRGHHPSEAFALRGGRGGAFDLIRSRPLVPRSNLARDLRAISALG